MPNDLTAQIFAVLRGSWRYRWHALGVAWLICLLGWSVVWLMPNTYESRAGRDVKMSLGLAERVADLGPQRLQLQ